MFSHEQATHVLGLIDKAIEVKGADYYYAGPKVSGVCLYGEYGEYDNETAHPVLPSIVGPGCLIGHVLVYDGVGLDRLRRAEGGDAQMAVDELHMGYPHEVAMALTAAQSIQDDGATWGEARAVYIEYLRRDDPRWMASCAAVGSFRVVDHVTNSTVRIAEAERTANAICREFNIQAGPGGRFGVEVMTVDGWERT